MADIKVSKLKIQGSSGDFYEFEGGSSECNYGLPIKITKLKNYQYDLDYSDFDYIYFEEHKEEAQITPKKIGACTSFWSNSFYGRNLDWMYNKEIEFVIKIPKREGYFSSISVCGGLTDLTRTAMESGTVNMGSLKLLPFFVRDGINSEGLVCSVNVVPTYNKETINPTVEEKHEIISPNLTRFILDRFSTASEAVTYIKSYVKLINEKSFQESGYDLHWMIADKNECYWLETDSSGNWVSGKYDPENKKYAILTNFHINTIDWDRVGSDLDGKFPTPGHTVMGVDPTDLGVDEFGSGLERYNKVVDALVSGISSKTDIANTMESVKYSSLYNSTELDFDNTYHTELVGDYTAQGGEILTVDNPKESFRSVWESACTDWESYDDDEARREQPDGLLWHTTHTTCIDMSDKSLNIYFDENFTLSSNYKIETSTGGVEIDDNSINSDKTWSSSKINTELSSKAEIDDESTELNTTWSSSKIDIELSSKAEINDTDMPSPTETWSSSKINTEIVNKTEIDDESTELNTTWSSDKINTELNDCKKVSPDDNNIIVLKENGFYVPGPSKTWKSFSELEIKKVLMNKDDIIIDNTNLKFTGPNQGIVFPASVTRIRFTLPTNGPQSVYFGVKAQKTITDENCFFQAITLNSNGLDDANDKAWQDWTITNIYMRDPKRGVFDEGASRDYQNGEDAGHIIDSSQTSRVEKSFVDITGEGIGETIEIVRNGHNFIITNYSNGKTATIGRYQFGDFRKNDLEYKFGFFTRSYETEDDFDSTELDYYKGLPGLEPKVSIDSLRKPTYEESSISTIYPCAFCKGDAGYTISNLEYYSEEILIKDDEISLQKTWSSSKINTELSSKAKINDTDMPSPTETWSSVKITDELSNKAEINDLSVASNKTWSSEKISNAIEGVMTFIYETDTQTLTITKN